MTLYSLLSWSLVALSIAGTVLNARKDTRGFYLWGAANVGWIAVDLKAGLYPQAALFGIYLGLCVYGLYKWRKGDG